MSTRTGLATEDDRPGVHRYTARVHPVPAPFEVQIVGWHAAFAAPPAAGIRLAAFANAPGPKAVGVHPAMALVRIEHAQPAVTDLGGEVILSTWEPDPHRAAADAISWRLMPAEARRGAWVIAAGSWAYSGQEAVLPASVVAASFNPPLLVSVYGFDPSTGADWVTTPT
ncbi:hypothetical protein ACWEVD_00405 [Nocardia thailandica]